MKTTDLVNIPFFDGLTPNELGGVATYIHRQFFPALATVITAGDEDTTVYFIVDGLVKIELARSNGKAVILALLGAGEMIGELGALQIADRFASVITLEKTSVFAMAGADFRSALSCLPVLSMNLTRILARRLCNTGGMLLSYTTDTIHGRLARLLYSFASEHGSCLPDGSILIPMRLTQSDLAAMVGATRGRVNEVLQEFKLGGLIKTDSCYRIKILQLENLKKYFIW